MVRFARRLTLVVTSGLFWIRVGKGTYPRVRCNHCGDKKNCFVMKDKGMCVCGGCWKTEEIGPEEAKTA